MRIATRLLQGVGLAALIAVGGLVGTGAGKLPGDQTTAPNAHVANIPPDIGPTGPGPTNPSGPLH
jgi:hypothetical protein